MLPLTSMIDVVFLLLVYFLVTSEFAQPERDLSAAVQTDGGGVRASDLQPQIIDVRGSGDEIVFVIGSQTVTTKRGLTQILTGLPKEPGVAIRAEHGVPISGIASAMQAAQDAGFDRRSYVPSED
ncbi:MAG: ExbD/TolR family protein [Phycisphaerales bacterium]